MPRQIESKDAKLAELHEMLRTIKIALRQRKHENDLWLDEKQQMHRKFQESEMGRSSALARVRILEKEIADQTASAPNYLQPETVELLKQQMVRMMTRHGLQCNLTDSLFIWFDRVFSEKISCATICAWNARKI